MQGPRAMTYKQLFLLILTIWSAELVTRFLFDVVMAPQMKMEFRTVYLSRDAERGVFLGSKLNDFGSRGWKIASVQPDPARQNQMIIFMQRQSAIRLDTTAEE
ncbi:MAG: hypothetical protein Fues2KO_12940 [Fuerstiella sp.]|jgi:hypothetical protein